MSKKKKYYKKNEPKICLENGKPFRTKIFTITKGELDKIDREINKFNSDKRTGILGPEYRYFTMQQPHYTREVKKFYEVMFDGKNTVPLFKGVETNTPHLVRPTTFYALPKKDSGYYSLVSYNKDYKKGTKVNNSEDINSIFGFVLDIDFHDGELNQEEIKRFGLEISYDSTLKFRPTYTIFTGRGLQLVFKIKRLYLHTEAVFNGAQKAYNELKKYYNEYFAKYWSKTFRVLGSPSMRNFITPRCDASTTLFNKFRAPGQYNKKANVYSEIIASNIDIVLTFGEILTELVGERVEYKKVVSHLVKQGEKPYNSKRKQTMLGIIYKRISEITACAIYISRDMGVLEGYRYDLFTNLTGEYFNAFQNSKKEVDLEVFKQNTIDKLYALNNELISPYFNSREEVEKFVSALFVKCSKSFVKRKDETLEEKVIVLQMARDAQYPFSYFFKEDRKEVKAAKPKKVAKKSKPAKKLTLKNLKGKDLRSIVEFVERRFGKEIKTTADLWRAVKLTLANKFKIGVTEKTVKTQFVKLLKETLNFDLLPTEKGFNAKNSYNDIQGKRILLILLDLFNLTPEKQFEDDVDGQPQFSKIPNGEILAKSPPTDPPRFLPTLLSS